uniref:Uncharacterized protein n=1 Tax=Kalanchoe fedtschenkoi TaxID=63787 RepID=A0A7N0ZYJ7_KALFE
MAAEFGAAVAIASVLGEQSSFLLYVKDDVERLIKELTWMKCFLKDGENSNDLIRQWMSDVRDLAYDSEDVIDTFLLKLGGPDIQASCFGTISFSCISYTKNLPSTYKLGCEIAKIMVKVSEISSRRQRYGLNAEAFSSSHSTIAHTKLMDLRRSAPYANNEDMVGLTETISYLTDELTNGEKGRFVISIFGMGGLGKTTLARKLYDTLRQHSFKSHAWVCVSQDYNSREILLKLIKSMINPTKEDFEGLTTNDLMEAYLRNFLSKHRFLVVLDDVWEKEAWESFAAHNCGSRVIITTRIRQVAALNNAYVHQMRYLQEEESWELFCKKVFLNNNGVPSSPNLEQLGKEMVAKCSGLPLAVVTLGGLLSTKSDTVSEWTVVRDNFWNELEKDSVHINALLLLSFKDLPFYLKPCFLYVGLFPKDFEIPIRKLLLLWVAEGFIGAEVECPESVAKSYFDELVGRSLFQKKGEEWIGSTCRVHDLLRDLASRRLKRYASLYIMVKIRYMICQIHHLTEGLLFIIPRLRAYQGCISTVLFEHYAGVQQVNVNTSSCIILMKCYVLMRFSLLRVIDIQEHALEHRGIPSEIGRLIHLRYLGFCLVKCSIRELPDTIGSLKALQTISIESGQTLSYLTLPNTMTKLQNLRHLIGNLGLGNLVGLQTLQGITHEQWCGIDTISLVNLRHLSLKNVPRDEYSSTRLYDNFRNTARLQTLALENPEAFELAAISASEIFKRCSNITHFKSSGIKFDKSSDMHEYAVNLQVLDLVYFKNPEEDPIPSIEKLPALRALRMKYYSAGTQKLVCSEGGFPQLRTLIIKLDDNVTFSVSESGMPLLTHLKVNSPDNFEAPQRLKDLIIKS